MPKILLVDDDPGVLFMLKEVLVEHGHEVIAHRSARAALSDLDGVAVVVTDLVMPEMTGLELLSAIHERAASLPVILITANRSEKSAVEALRRGAYDYLGKPFENDELIAVVERALETQELRSTARRLAAEQAIGKRFVGGSASMRRLLEAVQRIADRDVTVLVRGETGTGKELVGAMLHAQSRRAQRPIVRFNCAAIPSELAEAELFGHARGAFTGAHQSRRGFFAEADGGTLVLDEVGELPLPIQSKLLRALQEGEIQPVGSGRVEKVDVRIVALTNRNLREEASAGRFREDLYYRLAVVELSVPALRERREDIRPLAEEFVRRYADKFSVPDVRLSPDVLAALDAARWPGNVRELENTVARLVALSPGGAIGLVALQESGWHGARGDDARATTPPPSASVEEEAGTLEDGPSLKEQVEAFERGLISRAMAAAAGNQSEAARRLRTSRVTLIDKLKKYGIGAPA
jgi:two-component system response regulator AtoC